MVLKLYHTINGLAGHAIWLDRLMGWDALYLPVVMGIILLATWFWPGEASAREQRQRLVVYAIGAALLGLAAAQVISHLWLRDRPYVHHPAHLLVAPSPDPSFPSDHAVGAFGLAVPFVLARRVLGRVMLALAVMQAVGRVTVGTHYPTDVLGGAGVGTAAAVLVWSVRSWLEIPLLPCFSLARRLRLT